jgi:hypothetical protein
VAATYYMMVLIGCAQADGPCEPITTLPVAYRSQSVCLDARADIVSVSSGLGYSRVTAECRPQPRAPRKHAAKAAPTS